MNEIMIDCINYMVKYVITTIPLTSFSTEALVRVSVLLILGYNLQISRFLLFVYPIAAKLQF